MSEATPRNAPRISLGPLEMRLYLVAVLAGGYLVAWRAIATTPMTKSASPPPFVQLDEVPGARPPVIALPPGWQLASRREAAVVTHVPAPRPRVRTRSS